MNREVPDQGGTRLGGVLFQPFHTSLNSLTASIYSFSQIAPHHNTVLPSPRVNAFAQAPLGLRLSFDYTAPHSKEDS